MFDMIKKAQELQRKIKEAQEKLNAMEFTSSASNDLISIKLNGKREPLSISISDKLLSDKETLEDLVLIAMKDALSKVAEASEKEMKSATGNLPIPPGLF